MHNIIKAIFGALREVRVGQRYQYDYGQRLQFIGIPDLPRYYEVHFCNSGSTAMTTRAIGDSNGVDIPDRLFTTGADVIAYLYLHDDLTDGTTVYTVTIPVEARPMPDDYSGSPTDPDVLGQAVALLNHEIQDIEHAAEHAAEATASATLAESWAVGGTGTRENEDFDNAMYYYGQAHDQAAAAYGSEIAAAASATHAAQAEDTVTALVEGIPADYTELANAVEEMTTDKLDRIQSPGYGNLGLVIGSNGEVIPGELRLPQAVQTALLNVFQHVAYVDEHGAEALAALEAAMEVKVLESITAVINQGATVIYTDAGLDQLRPLMTVTATYSDGTTATVTDYELIGTLYAGECVIGVTYGNCTDTVTVTATQPDVTVVSISAAFSQGSAIIYPSTPKDDLRQYLTVTALYSNGMTATVTGYTIDGSLRAGTCTLTARFRGAAALFNVTVTAPSLVSISATYNPPTGFIIYSDDELDAIVPYLNVLAHYSDSSTAPVSDYALSGTFTPGTSIITITWSSMTTTVSVNVSEVVTVTGTGFVRISNTSSAAAHILGANVGEYTGNVTLYGLGKNLSYVSLTSASTSYGVTATPVSGGGLTITGQTSASSNNTVIVVNKIPKLPAGTYTVSGTANLDRSSSERLSVRTGDRPIDTISVPEEYAGSDIGYTFDVAENLTNMNLTFWASKTDNDPYSGTIYPQIEAGDTATAFEQYVSPWTFTCAAADLSDYLDQIVVRASGTTTIFAAGSNGEALTLSIRYALEG